MDPSEHDQRAHLKELGQTVEFLRERARVVELLADHVEWNEELGRDLVAPPLNSVARDRSQVGARERGLTQPDVGQFVRQGEDLRGLGVGAVDEDERCEVVDQGEPAELLRVECDAYCCRRRR